mmetsp:Transcript_6060/g.19386  ORF Transcript_6060/g.19386 Transcript_6060/m.19386 type:complete len:238 (-) Transcript_6060:34-747(-)
MATGSFPAGMMSPKSRDAQALPVRSPPVKRHAKADTCALHGVSTGPGISMSTTVGFCIEAAWMSKSAPLSKESEKRSALSVAVVAATTTMTSASCTACSVSCSRLEAASAAIGTCVCEAAGAFAEMTRMPTAWARSCMPARGVTTKGEATWPEPPPEYGLPRPHTFISSLAEAAGPMTARVRTLSGFSGRTPSFFRSTVPSDAASSAKRTCSMERWLDARASAHGNSQPGSVSRRMR